MNKKTINVNGKLYEFSLSKEGKILNEQAFNTLAKDLSPFFNSVMMKHCPSGKSGNSYIHGLTGEDVYNYQLATLFEAIKAYKPGDKDKIADPYGQFFSFLSKVVSRRMGDLYDKFNKTREIANAIRNEDPIRATAISSAAKVIGTDFGIEISDFENGVTAVSMGEYNDIESANKKMSVEPTWVEAAYKTKP